MEVDYIRVYHHQTNQLIWSDEFGVVDNSDGNSDNTPDPLTAPDPTANPDDVTAIDNDGGSKKGPDGKADPTQLAGGEDDVPATKASDPEAFKAAHDKIISQMSSVMKGEVGFGSYEIGGYKNATHWVAITAKNWSDLILTRREMKKMTKAWKSYYENRGEVEHVRNFTSRNIKRY